MSSTKSVFKNRYGELRSGWPILASLVLIILGQLIGRALVPDGREDEIIIKVIITVIYSLIAIGGGLLLFKLIYKRPLRQMGLIKQGWLSILLHGYAIGAVSILLLFVGLLVSGQAIVANVNYSKLLSIGMAIELISVHFFIFIPRTLVIFNREMNRYTLYPVVSELISFSYAAPLRAPAPHP